MLYFIGLFVCSPPELTQVQECSLQLLIKSVAVKKAFTIGKLWAEVTVSAGCFSLDKTQKQKLTLSPKPLTFFMLVFFFFFLHLLYSLKSSSFLFLSFFLNNGICGSSRCSKGLLFMCKFLCVGDFPHSVRKQ